jgi:phage nucleotide-binding protein
MLIGSTKDVGIHELKILIYGESGVGKTSLAKTIKEPLLLISAEAGLLPLRGESIDVIDITKDDKGNAIPKENRIDRLAEVYTYLLTDEPKKKYKWVMIDSLTELSQNLVEKLQKEFPERRDSLVLYGENSKRMRSIVKLFRDLPGYSVIFTALADIEKDDNGVRYQTIQMVGKIAQQLPAFFDEVFFMHVQKEDGKPDSRILVTGKSEKVIAKDRSGALEQFELADLQTVINKIRDSGKKKEEQQKQTEKEVKK